MTERATLESMTFNELLEGYSDCYKSLYGFRPRGEITHGELVSFWETYDERMAEELALDAQAEQAAVERLNQLINEYTDVMPYASVGDVMRYIADAEGCDNDWEYLDYKMGVPYGICEQLANILEVQ